MTNGHAAARRTAGVAVPLFSLRTAYDWGVGEILDLVPLARWASRMGQGIVQLLPVNETEPDEASPYRALSAYALDPLYLSLRAVDDLPVEERAVPAAVRDATTKTPVIPRRLIRDAKLRALESAWARFRAVELRPPSKRGRRFSRFLRAQRHWLDDYAAFRVLKEIHHWQHWHAWPAAERARDDAALGTLRRHYAERIGFFRYVQWLASEQWRHARREAAAYGLRIMGDLPFVIGDDSADGWASPDLFVPGWEIGAPPDDFSAVGQKWGLPLYDWPRHLATDFQWWRHRIRRAAELYDLFRIDHIVGVFRTYAMPVDGGPERRFHPADEPAQIAQGEAFLAMIEQASGTAVPIAEDLGTIPDFVRTALAARGIPGYKVLRWEWREGWFTEPSRYAPQSVATTGTHDTTTLAEWWTSLPVDQRANLVESLRIPIDSAALPEFCTAELRRAILARMYEAGSTYVILPIQDLFGWNERINLPMTVSDANWNFRLPIELGATGEVPAELEREGEIVRDLIQRTDPLRWQPV